MNHLDDTSIVAVNAGEFGIMQQMVSDIILQTAEWKGQILKDKTIDVVLLQHNTLSSAYHILIQQPPREKYYEVIKTMASRHINYDNEIGERRFDLIEYALYGLAKFKLKADVQIIKFHLMENVRSLGDLSFRLMREFPDTSFLEVYKRYYDHYLFRLPCFDGFDAHGESFVSSLAEYEDVASAKMLTGVLNRKTMCKCITNYLHHDVVSAVWAHRCVAYKTLRKRVEREARQFEKYEGEMSLPVVPSMGQFETIRWN